MLKRRSRGACVLFLLIAFIIAASVCIFAYRYHVRTQQIKGMELLQCDEQQKSALHIGITPNLGSGLTYAIEKTGASDGLILSSKKFKNDLEALEALESGQVDCAIVQTQQMVKRLPYYSSEGEGFKIGLAVPLYKDASQKTAVCSNGPKNTPGIIAYVQGTPEEYASAEAANDRFLINKYGNCRRIPILDEESLISYFKSGQADVIITDREKVKDIGYEYIRIPVNSVSGPDIYILVYNKNISKNKLNQLSGFSRLWFYNVKKLENSSDDFTINAIAKESSVTPSDLKLKLSSKTLSYFSAQEACSIKSSGEFKDSIRRFYDSWSYVNVYDPPFKHTDSFSLNKAHSSLILDENGLFSAKQLTSDISSFKLVSEDKPKIPEKKPEQKKPEAPKKTEQPKKAQPKPVPAKSSESKTAPVPESKTSESADDDVDISDFNPDAVPDSVVDALDRTPSFGDPGIENISPPPPMPDSPNI